MAQFTLLNKCKTTEAMKLLSYEHREILIFINVQSMSYDEAAKALGISRDEVLTRLMDARDNLQGFLDSPIPAEKKKRYIPPRHQGYLQNIAFRNPVGYAA